MNIESPSQDIAGKDQVQDAANSMIGLLRILRVHLLNFFSLSKRPSEKQGHYATAPDSTSKIEAICLKEICECGFYLM